MMAREERKLAPWALFDRMPTVAESQDSARIMPDKRRNEIPRPGRLRAGRKPISSAMRRTTADVTRLRPYASSTWPDRRVLRRMGRVANLLMIPLVISWFIMMAVVEDP